MSAWSAWKRANVTYGARDLLAVAALGAVVALWASVAGGGFSLSSLLACELLFCAFYLAGSLLAAVPALAAGVVFDLPLRLLSGYTIVSALLFALTWFSPLGIIANFSLLLGGALALFFGAARRERVEQGPAGLACLLLCVVAVSLWCQDSLRPTLAHDDEVVFKPWVDGFYHAVHIRLFGAAHGATTIDDFRLAGIPARPYHYGVYFAPAFIKQMSGMHSYAAFAGILTPLGVLLTGLSAYALGAALWGAGCGLTAAAVLMLLPDGAQQGMSNTFMSYHWLTHISPSATHGLAVLGVAWLFVLRGCERGSKAQLATGWAFAALLLLFKLHYAVASGLLLLLAPAVFFARASSVWRRVAWGAVAFFVYLAALKLGQRVPGVPLIRFDGSAVGEILRLVQSFAPHDAINDYVRRHTGAKASWLADLAVGVPFVVLSVLGVLAPLLFGLIFYLRKRVSSLVLAFPIALLANFLIMFFGLALDFESSTPDELSHRPLMIVYFFSATWVGGALGLLLARLSLSARARWLAGGLVVLALLAVPARFGAGVQLMRAMPQLSPLRVSSALFRVTDYIRGHGGLDDVLQDSQFDRIYAFSAMAERRAFVANTLTRMPYHGDLVEQRMAAIERFMGLRKPQAIKGMARAFGFRWFILERGDRVDWPPEIVDNPVLVAGGLRLYEF